MITAQSFTTREVPWMQLGAVIDRDVDAAEAARIGGLDFEIRLDPVARVVAGAGEGGDYGGTFMIPKRFAVTRTDTDAVFDIVSADYVPLQYADAFAFMDAVHPRYVAAGVLRGGAQGFMVVQRPDLTELDLDLSGVRDPHELYVILRTSHDRSRGLEVALMPLRGRCMNQLPLASLTNGAERRWAVKHVGDPAAKLTAAKSVWTRVDQYAQEFERIVRRLVDVEVGPADASYVLKTVLPDRPRRDEQIGSILDAWKNSDRVGFDGTGWGLVNATSEFMEWGRESRVRTPQSRFLNGLDGATAKTVARVAQRLLAGRN